MGLEIKGIEALLANLSQTGDRAVRGVSDEIKRGAKKIQDLAREYAPEDEGNLSESIKVEVDRSGINGRVQAFVYVDGDAAAEDGTVGDYALAVHEGVAPYGSGGHGRIGEKSMAKDAGRGVVGGKFMERAVDQLQVEIAEDLTQAARKVFR